MKGLLNSNSSNEKVQISVTQMFMLAVTFVISTADVFLPAFVAQEAKRDAWISVLIGTLSSLLIGNLLITLGLKYPNKTLIQYSCDILGKPLGKVIGLCYVYFFLSISWLVTRELEEIFVIAFNPDSPIFIYGVVVIFVAAYAVYNGLEVIARINEILLPIGLLVLFFIALLNIPNLNMNNYLPIFYDGLAPSFKGSFLIQTWITEVVVFLQILPFIKERQKIRKYFNLSILSLGSSLLVGVLTIGVFGVSLTGKMLFPALEYVRYAKLGHYIENLDISIMLVWISGIFVKISFSFFAGTHALAQVFEIKSYKNLIIPTGIIIIVFSFVSGRTLTEILFFLKYILPFYFLTMTTIIPVSLLIISNIRKNKL